MDLLQAYLMHPIHLLYEWPKDVQKEMAKGLGFREFLRLSCRSLDEPGAEQLSLRASKPETLNTGAYLQPQMPEALKS